MDSHYSQRTFLDIMSSTYSPVSSSVPDLVADTSNISDINDLFDFEGFASDSHSPTTISPNHTPSPLPTSQSPFARSASSPPSQPFSFPIASGSGSSAMDYAFGYDINAESQVKVKEEPMDWQDFGLGFDINELGAPPAPATSMDFETSSTNSFPSIFSSNGNLDMQSEPQSMQPTPPSAPNVDFAGLPKDQQGALQQLMMNILEYQNNFGLDMPPQQAAPASEQPTTIEPSLVFSTSPTNTFNFGSSNPSTFTSTNASASGSGSNTTSYTTPAQTLPAINEHDSDQEEPLRSVHEARASSVAGPSRLRQSSVLSSASDIGSRLDRLAPREAIFSAGKGKGGKKGGGLSSVVRGDDEDLDDDDSWRPSPEEYKKLSSKEKRQLRNKLSARAFRTRRKDYIGTLEGHIKDRDDVIDEMRSQLITHRIENQDLRKELEALKASTMKILHPESALAPSPAPALMTAFALSPSLPAASTPIKKRNTSPAPTPKFNPRKDLPSSSTEASRAFWGNDNMFGGGSTICHHTFTPPPVFRQQQVNMNPLLNAGSTVEATPIAASSKDISMPFSEWSENNNFNLRSMDNYRMQMWSRLTREAQAEKDKVPTELRPKFYVESKSPTPAPASSTSAEASLAAHLANAAAGHITTKLASSFWSAFSGPSSLDTDKLSAVVTGTAKLAVVPSSSSSTYKPSVELNEKTSSGPLDEEALNTLMGGLKLQTPAGSGMQLQSQSRLGNRVRENPLGAFSSFIKLSCPCPTRA